MKVEVAVPVSNKPQGSCERKETLNQSAIVFVMENCLLRNKV